MFPSLVHPEAYIPDHKCWTNRARRLFPGLLCLAPLPLLANCIRIPAPAHTLPTQRPPINMSITI